MAKLGVLLVLFKDEHKVCFPLVVLAPGLSKQTVMVVIMMIMKRIMMIMMMMIKMPLLFLCSWQDEITF